MDRVSEIRIFGYLESSAIKMCLRQFEPRILFILPNFWHIWWFFKMEHNKGAAKLWKIIKYAKILAKKIKKTYFLKPIFWLIPGTWKSITNMRRHTKLQNYIVYTPIPYLILTFKTCACFNFWHTHTKFVDCQHLLLHTFYHFSKIKYCKFLPHKYF